MAGSPNDRRTLPGDLREFARESEREFAAAEADSGIVDLGSVPWRAATHDKLLAMPLGDGHSFLLSLVDGRCTVEMLADMSGFGHAKTLALVAEMIDLGAVTVRRR